MATHRMILDLRPTQRPILSPRQYLPAVGVEVKTERTGERELPEGLMEIVAVLIGREDPLRPMSDAAIASAVAERDVELAREIVKGDIALARHRLGLGAAAERTSLNRE